MSVQATSEVEVARAKEGALRRTLTIWGAIACSIGLMGPTMAININPQAPAGQVGRAVPLVFLLSTVGVLLVAYGFIRLCQHFNHAGSLYGFIGVTLGPRAGFVAGWALLGTYVAYAATTIAGVGLFASQFLDATGAWSGAGWIPFSAAAFLAVWLLAAFDTKVSTRTLLSIEGVTVTLIAIVAVTIFAKLVFGGAPAGQGFTLSVFSLPEGTGISALFFAMTFGFLSFAGYEVASTLGEETRDPRRTIPLALLGTVVFAGIFYTLVSMAESMGFGTSAAGVKAFTESGSLIGDLGARYVTSTVGDVITLGAAFSAFASALACSIGASRLLFALGRDGFVSPALGRVSPRHGTPTVALAVVMAVVALEIFGLRLLATAEVIDVFFWTATCGTLALLVAYALSTAGAIRFLFLGPRRLVAAWEVVIPVAALAFIGYTLYKNVYPVPDAPYNLFPYVVLGWLAVSVAVVLLVPGFARRIGERLREEDGLVDAGPGDERRGAATPTR
jgi:amino acid transporter